MDQEQKTPERTLATSVSFIASAVLLIIAIAIGGFYILEKGKIDNAGMVNPQVAVTPADGGDVTSTIEETAVATAALATQGSSDELSSIESDLGATDLSSLEDIDQL